MTMPPGPLVRAIRAAARRPGIPWLCIGHPAEPAEWRTTRAAGLSFLMTAGIYQRLRNECGFVSWARLKAEVEARSMDLARRAEACCEASVRDWTGLAARMLAATPEIAGYDFATEQPQSR